MKEVLIDWFALISLQLTIALFLRLLWKPLRYTIARHLRRYANWVSPDNF